MDRRSFLRRLALLTAAGCADPEALLWTPKAMITVPAMPVPLMAVSMHARAERPTMVHFETSDDGILWVRQSSMPVTPGEWFKLNHAMPQARLFRAIVGSEGGKTDLDDMYIIGGKGGGDGLRVYEG